MLSPLRSCLEPRTCTLEPRSFTLWMFGREAAVTIRQLKSFAFERDCKACSDRKGLSGEALGRQNSEDLPLIWIAMQLWANHHQRCLVSITVKEK